VTRLARPAVDPAAMMAEPDFRHVKQAIVSITGLQYYDDKEQALAERAEQQRHRLGCSRPDYLHRVLGSGGDEMAALIDEITIGETYFFRYPAQFDALRRVVLPERLSHRRRDRVLRIWSAGCSTGAEPYSIAITLRREFAVATAGWDIALLATDINRKALAQARSGSFTAWELRDSPESLKKACFVQDGRRWLLRSEYRDLVEFRYQNLVTGIEAFARDHANDFDVILCRNVMIYFSPALMRRLIHLFSECLTDGGWLFVGHAEPYFEIANVLSPVRVENVTLYRKGDVGLAAAFPGDAGHEPGVAAADVEEWIRGEQDLVPAAMPSGTTPSPADDRLADAVPIPVPVPPPAQPPAPVLDGSALRNIRRHADAGRWDEAVAACEQALRQYPMDPALRYVHGLVCEQIGASDVAEDAFGRAIYLERNFALAHFHIGLCQVRRKDHRAAKRSFANAMRILDGHDPHEVLAMSEGLTASELRELTRVQIAALAGR
jgi:chemotaxis protein methyltransferase CheR